jgi:hypothetical protein
MSIFVLLNHLGVAKKGIPSFSDFYLIFPAVPPRKKTCYANYYYCGRYLGNKVAQNLVYGQNATLLNSLADA